jgi:NAD dependent epimerase/dehydratase family
MPEAGRRVVVTGAAGLVGQNLVPMLREAGWGPVVVIDRNEANLALLARLNPGVTTIRADLADAGDWRLATRPTGATYDIAGVERIDYVDIIRAIRDARGLRTPIVQLPVPLFAAAMRVYGWFTQNPPFTPSQLRALMAGDDFAGVDLEATFGVRPTPFAAAIRETFCDSGHPCMTVAAVE